MKPSLLLLLFLSLGISRFGLPQDTSPNSQKQAGEPSSATATTEELLQDVHSLFLIQSENFSAELQELEKEIKIVTEGLGAEHRITLGLIDQQTKLRSFSDSILIEPSESEFKKIMQGMEFKPKLLKFTDYDQPKYPTLVTLRRLRDSKSDGFVFFYRDHVIRKFLDTDKDQKFDQWIYFKNGVETYREVDADGDEKVDSCQRTRGDIVDLMLDRNNDGEIEEVYRGSLSEIRSSLSFSKLRDYGFDASELAFDEPISKVKKSNDLDRDKLLMWQTVLHKTGKFHVSPVSAINASRRVFETIKPQLVGKNIEETRKLIGYRERPKYGYHDAFWELKEHAFVYRFDCGNYGWQYNLYLDDEKTVKRVEIKWIH